MALKSFSRKFVGGGLSPEDRKEALEELFVFGKENQLPFFRRMAVLTIVSTIIATGGLLSDSAAVVIGAMLIAPLMRPVMSAAAAITMGWSERLYQSLLLIAVMSVAVILISYFLALLSPDMISMTEQTLARTRPTFFDLVIALASGVGGAYVMTRKESSAIPGVAMAVSLLPPLASCGILLEFAEYEFALKAFILFFTNFLAMTLAASMTFVVTGMSRANVHERVNRFIINFIVLFVVLIGATSVPLFYYSNEEWYDAEYQATKSEIIQNWLKDNDLEIVNVAIDEEKQIYSAVLRGPKPPLSIEDLYNSISESRIKKGDNRPFMIKTSWLQSVRSSWPPPNDIVEDVAVDDRTFEAMVEMLHVEWQWTKTQYSDADWIENANPEKYTFTLGEDNKLVGTVDCNKLQMGYLLSRDLLNFKLGIMTLAQCENPELDQTFINDLDRVINYQMEDDFLVLQLDNNAGLMYFIKSEN
ncbi:MAG: TIGR00341 family protein [Gammaproteobacteria bacterium]